VRENERDAKIKRRKRSISSEEVREGYGLLQELIELREKRLMGLSGEGKNRGNRGREGVGIVI
jgi:hypothetical protein